MKTGADVADLNAKFERAGADYKAERMAEQFRLQIIDPKVVDHVSIKIGSANSLWHKFFSF